MATVVTMGSVTFALDGTLTWGTDIAGKAWVVVPAGSVNVTAISPAQTTDGGDVVNGAMLNPVRTGASTPDHGYDGRYTNYNAVENDAPPISVTAGDIIVKVISDLTPVGRGGIFEEIAALHVLAEAPTGEYLLRSSISWAGDTLSLIHI